MYVEISMLVSFMFVIQILYVLIFVMYGENFFMFGEIFFVFGETTISYFNKLQIKNNKEMIQ